MFSKRVIVGTSPTLIQSADGVTIDIALQRRTATDVYVGAEDVTVTTGFPLTGIQLRMPPGEAIYGVVRAETEVVHVLVIEDPNA